MKSTSLVAGTVVLALLAAAALLGQVNFSRWDNAEAFLPAIWYAHRELLRGHFPLWNPFQNLGEPLHALGIAGTLYPPYTIAVAITSLAHWPPAYALDLIVIAHAAFGAIGLNQLLVELGVRRPIALAAAISALLSGYALVMGGIWVHVMPNLAWSIWAMWALHRVVRQDAAGSAVGVAILSLLAVFLTGHVQMAANVWLAAWLWTIALAATQRVLRRRALTFVFIGCAAALLAAPVLLPTAMIMPDAIRLNVEVDAGPGFPLSSLVGMLIPVIGASDGAVSQHILLTTFMGAWVVPALVLGAGVVAHRRREADRPLLLALLVTTATALVFVWLNLGPRAGLYSALHALPVWSHFRVPFKYFERVVPLLVIAAALALELAARHPPPRRYAHAALGLALVAATAWLLRPAAEPLAWLWGTACLLTIVASALLPPVRFIRVALPFAVVQAVGVIALANSPRQFKTYRLDRQPSARLQLSDTIGRALPLSEGSHVRPLARFYAGMQDGYASATGTRFGLTAGRYEKYFPTQISGVPLLPADRLLNARLLGHLGVRYLVVDARDERTIRAVTLAFPNARVGTTPHARIFALPIDPMRAYFASELLPGHYESVLDALTRAAPGRPVAIDAVIQPQAMPAATILRLAWLRDRIEAHVHAPQGGMLVFSTSYSDEWLAEVDGQRRRVIPANGMFAGLRVPAEAKHVMLWVRRWPLYLGFGAAALGAALSVLAVRITRRTSREPLDRADPALSLADSGLAGGNKPGAAGHRTTGPSRVGRLPGSRTTRRQ